MSLIFNDVTFAWHSAEEDFDADGNQVPAQVIFSGFSAEFPMSKETGLTVLAGPNGSGKSTFLLLASGRLEPEKGEVSLLGKNPARLDQEQKNLLASVIYQNMEFETEDQVGSLLGYVYQNGALKGKAAGINGPDLLKELIQVFGLEHLLDRALTHLSKGEIQRVLLAFSLLYGSASVFMDEPFFALEESQKEEALSYLKKFCARTGTAVFVAMHELDLTRKFADRVLLFNSEHSIVMGTAQEVLTPQDLEKAYGFPASMLKHYEEVNAKNLSQIAEVYSCR